MGILQRRFLSLVYFMGAIGALMAIAVAIHQNDVFLGALAGAALGGNLVIAVVEWR